MHQIKNNEILIAGINTIDDEREEGEIIDGYEAIISSDEEICMRQRMQELEARNAELEKLDHISCTPWMQDQRRKSFNYSVSSISSEEYFVDIKSVIKPRKSRRHQTLRRRKHKLVKRRKTSITNIPARSHRTDLRLDIISLDSCGSSESLNTPNVPVNNDENISSIHREQLRLAVNHKTKPAAHLKDRLHLHSTTASPERTDQSNNFISIENNDAMSSSSLDEQELRLIALKSAVLKKHYARKKREAESPYSPTQFQDLLGNNANLRYDNMDVVDAELEDLQSVMDISPANSPVFVMEETNQSIATEDKNKNFECTNPVDMDIANTDDSDDDLLVYMKQTNQWLPVLESKQQSTNNETHLKNGNYMSYIDQMPFGIYIPDMQYQSQPPLPSTLPNNKVDPLIKIVPDINAEPRFFQCTTGEFHENSMEFGSHSDASPITIPNKKKQNNCLFRIDDSDQNNKLLPPGVESDNRDSDEEANALRALLLAKFPNPKEKAPTLPSQINNSSKQDPIYNNSLVPATDFKIRKEVNICPLNGSTEIVDFKEKSQQILKNAVRRLRMCNTLHDNPEPTNISKNLIDCPLQENVKSSPLNGFKKHCKRIVDKLHSDRHEIDQSSEIINKPLIKLKTDTLPNKYLLRTHQNDCNEPSRNVLDEITLSSTETIDSYEEPTENSVEVNKDEKLELKTNVGINKTQKNCPPKVCQTKENNFIEKKSIPRIKGNEYHNKLRVKNIDELMNKSEGKPIVENTALTEMHSTTTENVLNSNNNNNNFNKKPLVILNTEDSVTHKTSPTLASSVKLDVSQITKVVTENKKKSYSLICSNTASSKTVISVKTATLSKQIPKPTPNVRATTANPSVHNNYALNGHIVKSKFVKRNKVINTKLSPVCSTKTPINAKPILAIQTATQSPNQLNQQKSRLITSLDQVKISVNKLIIPIGSVDSDSTTTDIEIENIPYNDRKESVLSFDSIKRTKFSKYFDNSSSLCLEMVDNPLVNISLPAIPNSEENVKEIPLINFEKKIDNFLRDVRSKTNSLAQTKSVNNLIKPLMKSVPIKPDTTQTTLVLPHLPEDFQEEYKQLVRRIGILEKQKQDKKVSVPRKVEKCLPDENAKPLLEVTNTTIKPLTSSGDNNVIETTAESPSEINKDQLSVKLKSKDEKEEKIDDKTTASNSKENDASSVAKSLELRKMEKQYNEFGSSINTELTKTLGLVKEAKQAKLSKYKVDARMKELELELTKLQNQSQSEQKNIERLFPNIHQSYRIIEKYKMHRSKISTEAKTLGRLVEGVNYRIINSVKKDIEEKAKILQYEVALINSLSTKSVKTNSPQPSSLMKIVRSVNITTGNNQSTSQFSVTKPSIVSIKNQKPITSIKNQKSLSSKSIHKVIRTISPSKNQHSSSYNIKVKNILKKSVDSSLGHRRHSHSAKVRELTKMKNLAAIKRSELVRKIHLRRLKMLQSHTECCKKNLLHRSRILLNKKNDIIRKKHEALKKCRLSIIRKCEVSKPGKQRPIMGYTGNGKPYFILNKSPNRNDERSILSLKEYNSPLSTGTLRCVVVIELLSIRCKQVRLDWRRIF